MKRVMLLAAAAVMLAQMGSAQADQLQDIHQRGVLRVAVPQDFPPFGSVGTDLQPRGYDIDMANYLAKSMKLKLQLVPVTSANRVPYLQTNKVDVVISSLGKNAARERVIDFSEAYAPFFLGVFGAKSSPLRFILSLRQSHGLRLFIAHFLAQRLHALAGFLHLASHAFMSLCVLLHRLRMDGGGCCSRRSRLRCLPGGLSLTLHKTLHTGRRPFCIAGGTIQKVFDTGNFIFKLCRINPQINDQVGYLVHNAHLRKYLLQDASVLRPFAPVSRSLPVKG